MKKLFLSLAVVSMSVSFFACGNSDAEKAAADSDSIVATEVIEEEVILESDTTAQADTAAQDSTATQE